MKELSKTCNLSYWTTLWGYFSDRNVCETEREVNINSNSNSYFERFPVSGVMRICS